MRSPLCLHTLTILCCLCLESKAADYTKDIRPLLGQHCFDCHGDEDKPKGGVNLERFKNDADAMGDRSVWAGVFEKIESHQMPPPKRESQPTTEQRTQLMAWVSDLAARPDPALGARDPGKPVLRRLTRLEYNNTVRDLLGLDSDVFMFPERLPLIDKNYFQPAKGAMGEQVEVRLRENGARYPVLLPQAGLPADSRAEHGFSNRGDAMNFSPLMLEQYVTLAGSIVNHPELPQCSTVFAALLGVEAKPLELTTKRRTPAQKGDLTVAAAGVFAPNAPTLKKAAGSADNIESRFREAIVEAFREGHGGVFDSADSVAGVSTVPGKGGLLRVRYGDAGAKAISVNPNEDIWLVGFSTAEATSGKKLFTNQTKGAKKFELTFKVEDGDADEGITHLGICVLGRKNQSGAVSLTAHFSDSTETALTADIAEGAAGTTVFTFASVPGEHIKSLAVDGSNFSGDYVLLDDLGFITDGKPVPNARPPVNQEIAKPKAPAAPTTPATKPGPKPKPVPAPERLAQFVERAFRRPASAEEQTRYSNLFDSALKSGKAEAEAMRVAAQAVLSSPAFLFLSEPMRAEAPKVRPLDDFELAARLSYFLWSSAPDTELLAAARAGKLREPAALEAHTQRMLRDPKARELSESFAVQWLRLDQLYTAKPDRELFKTFYSGPMGKSTLHGAGLVEALLLFETVMTENRSILDFVAADYTWLNPSLAKLYHLNLDQAASEVADTDPNTTRELKKAGKDANNDWRRVPLTDASRGGFLTMSAPLVVTSLPFRTSPVKRGAWLLETVFNRPPTEPKVAFTVENDTKEAAQAMSIRQRFEAHRNKAACYSCHIRLDPPGFALERYDAVGAWRETDGGAPVDAKGEWNGHPFEGPAAYKALLAKNPDEFTRGFIEHLLSYALGRKLEVFDMPTVAEIQRTAAADGNKFSRVVTAIIASHPFRNTRNSLAEKTKEAKKTKPD